MIEAFVLACAVLMGNDSFGVRENAEMTLRGLRATRGGIVWQLAVLAPRLQIEAGTRAARISEEVIGVPEEIQPGR